MDYEPYYYLKTEDIIPEDAAYVIMGGLITALVSVSGAAPSRDLKTAMEFAAKTLVNMNGSCDVSVAIERGMSAIQPASRE